MSYLQKNKTITNEKQVKVQSEILPVTKLRFNGSQLNNLNYIFNRKLLQYQQKCMTDESSIKLEEIVERLLQRLISSVGSQDERFSSMFLVSVHDSNIQESRKSLEYIVRLDKLSTPTVFDNDEIPNLELVECNIDGPSAGFSKIRLRNKTATAWSEFINSSGYLRRDKIQERYVELLARAASCTNPTTILEVNENISCGIPGKIFDACTLFKILQMPAEERIFFGPAPNNLKFPDPRDFRLAIIDEPSGIKIRVGFLAQNFFRKDVEVTLHIGISVDFWPQNTDFPHRISISHTDFLLYYQAAEKGIYLLSSSQQNTNWRIGFPATEISLLNYYDQKSPISNILQILYLVLDEIHKNVVEEKCKFPQELLTKRPIRETFWKILEEDESSPLSALQNWTSSNISKYVLQVLDRIIGLLRQLKVPSYFFPTSNLLPEPSYIYEEDYLIEANRFHLYIAKMFDESLRPITENDDWKKMNSYQNMEDTLITKWCDFIYNMLPPKSTRSSRFGFSNNSTSLERFSDYTQRQIDYIGLLLENMLIVKQKSVQILLDLEENQIHPTQETPTEDIIYLLVSMIEQAKDCKDILNKPSKLSKIRNKIDVATAKLVENLRKDKQISNLNLSDDTILVKAVLKWLYKGLDQSKNYLGLILRPYLNKLFYSSHENSWHLEEIKNNELEEELRSLGIFSKLVNENKITPASGLVEAVNKNWNWAKNILSFVEKTFLRVVFIPSRSKCNRHILSLPSYERKTQFDEDKNKNDFDKRMYTLQERRKIKNIKNATLPGKTFLKGFDYTSEESLNDRERIFSHRQLKLSSPLNEIFQNSHRFGIHRCPGNLMKTLVNLQKVSILQEVSYYLPPSERQEMLNAIQKISKESKRQVVKRRYTLPPLRNPGQSISGSRKKDFRKSFVQIYRPTSEDSITQTEKERTQETREEKNQTWCGKNPSSKMNFEKIGSCKNLLETCRVARLKEDSKIMFHENIKVKSLFKFDEVN